MRKLTIHLPSFQIPAMNVTVPSSVVKVFRYGCVTIAGLVLIVIVGIGSLVVIYQHRIYPRVQIGSVNVAGLSELQAQDEVQKRFDSYLDQPIVFIANDRTWKLEPRQLGLSLNATASAQVAYKQGHRQTIRETMKDLLHIALHGTKVSPVIHYDIATYTDQLATIIQSLDIQPQSAKITYVDNQFVVGPSIVGSTVDKAQLYDEIRQHLNTFTTDPITMPIRVVQPGLTAERAQQLVPSLTNYAQQPLELTYANKHITLDVQTILNLINYDQATGDGFSFSQDKLNAYIDSFAQDINRPAKEAHFQFDNGRVTAFQASQDGVEVDRAALADDLSKTLLSGSGSRVIPIPVKVTQATVTTESVNNLGIKELLAHGESNYKGSPADRIFNLKLAISRINGALIAPGKEFSFNDTVGDISQASGYRQALVILSGKTVLGDGGGVCQVSTTVFRAALNAGLPITARTAHAYRVGYYENDAGPGLDATIYQPGVDLRFKNDTDHYILLQATTDDANTKIYIDLYGTSDGRVATVSKPVYLSTTPAPPDIHQDDPTLPVGTVKQVEHSIPGAKTIFYRKVVRDGETIINESFTSNFQPWAAVFLVGTKTD